MIWKPLNLSTTQIHGQIIARVKHFSKYQLNGDKNPLEAFCSTGLKSKLCCCSCWIPWALLASESIPSVHRASAGLSERLTHSKGMPGSEPSLFPPSGMLLSLHANIAGTFLSPSAELCQVASVVSDSVWPQGLQPTRLLCPWVSPGKNIGVGCHALLQGIFLTQGLNPSLLCLLYWQVGSLPLHQPEACYHLDFGLTVSAQEKASLSLSFPLKNPPAMQETWVQSTCWEDPLEKGMATLSSILAWRIYGQRSLVGHSPWGHKESDTTEQLRLSDSNHKWMWPRATQVISHIRMFPTEPASVTSETSLISHCCLLTPPGM